ncbi:Acyl-ACP thioesterase [Alkalispirochaeta americana]|uniref:Acyl-ACP thioesterase n=1 Tax=Alkalispirochaeta americana TaxID=159291 RepID=A0A1N6RY25_9SPIO|nr:acyl-ACP thioesterase domain-containing protein [Alkalispirochaeta americana]SIQ33576.1 Acyl-ACP thioesterase [Alkalispirochaeta americana]
MTFEYSMTIPSFLCAPDDRLGLDGMASLFQEGAWRHAEKLGIAFTEDEPSLFWVLHRLGVRCTRRPAWGEDVVITTWPSRMERLLALREFTLHTTGGELLAEATSSWIILTARESKPVRPERYFPPEKLTGAYQLEMPLGRMPTIPPEEALPLLEAARWHRVRPSDTDRNAHVNNARYAQWFLDEAPRMFSSPAGLHALSFTAETKVGQEYAVITGGTEEAPIAEIHVRDEASSRGSATDQAPTTDTRCACRLHCIA